MRFHSANIVRIHCARSGTSMPARRSTAIDEPELVVERADPVVTVHQHQRLARVAVLGELLGRAMHVADHRLGARDDLAVELEHHAQHAVRRRVLRPDVEDHLLGRHRPESTISMSRPPPRIMLATWELWNAGRSACRPSLPILRGRSETGPGDRPRGGRCRRVSSARMVELDARIARPRPLLPRPPASAGHRGWNRHPAGIRVGSGGSPTSRGRSAASALRHDVEQRTRVRVRAARSAPCFVGPTSTMRPRYITATRSATVHASPRSWVTIRMLMPSTRRAASSRSRRISPADGRIEVRHGLVGHDHPRLQRERTGDHHALPLPARQLVREPQEEPLRRTEPGSRQRLGDELLLVARAPCGSAGPRPPSRRRSGEGSTRRWGPDRPSAPGGGTPAGPCRAARPRTGSGPGPAWTNPMIERASVVLPQPDSPASARISPSADREVHAVDRAGRRRVLPAEQAGAARERHVEVLHLQERRPASTRPVRRRSASARRRSWPSLRPRPPAPVRRGGSGARRSPARTAPAGIHLAASRSNASRAPRVEACTRWAAPADRADRRPAPPAPG